QTVAEVVTAYMAVLTSERVDHDRALFDAGLDSLGALEFDRAARAALFAKGAAHSPVRAPDDPRACGVLRLTGRARARGVGSRVPPCERRATELISSVSRPAIGHRARCAPAAGGDSRHQAGGPRAEHRPPPGPVRPQRRAADHVPAAPD